ncbi:ABC transporter permease [Paenibacillus sp. Marseille-Q4541]|uniref:ABC transporter permease n=1 Tax=Paenibacillus sp. Marseille-Q4541 TaxID=2831522 RepID=UPI001BAB5214|nr:ABC transporter permease [Paenibacillus sp. Marseille-Q4541]
MAAVYSLCLANLRKKKIHNRLIGLLILLSTLLLATSVTVIFNTTNLFTDMHNKTRGSHEILMLRDELHKPQEVYHWWQAQQGVRTSSLIPYRMLAGMKIQGDAPSAELSSITLYMMDTKARPVGVDELLFAQGKESVLPEKGKIWIPTSIAYLYEISVGDTIEFSAGEKKFDLQVSALVVDIPFGAPFATEARIWMNDQDYIQQVQDMQGKEQYMLGLRFDDYDQSASYWNRFEQDMGTPYLESKISFEQMSSFYLVMNKVIGFIMIFLGIVMVLVALFTIGFTISDDVLSNYRTIGVIKALGLSSKKMIGVYVMQYVFISVLSIIPGLLASHFVSKMIVESSLSSLRIGGLQEKIGETLIPIAAGSFVFILVILCVLVYANKARNIQPMQAIRYGMSEFDHSKMTKRITRKEQHFLSWGKAPLLVVIGLKNILKNKKASILMTLLATIMTAVLVLGFVLLYSISNIKQTSALWGYDSSDISLRVVNSSTFSRTAFDRILSSDPRIKNISWQGYVNGVVSSEKSRGSAEEHTQTMNFSIFALDGSYDEVGYTNTRGRNPQNKNEISIGIRVAKELNKDIGDVVDVYVDGAKHKLMVSGIFQSIANQSVSARIMADILPDGYDDYIVAFINVHDEQNASQVVSEINEKYKNSLSAATMETLLVATFKQAVASLLLPMSMMGLLFTAVTVIIIYSISRINIKKENKTYGIYKSIGLSSIKIRLSITMGNIALSGIGVLIGIVLGVYFIPIILGSILSDYGITDLPLILNGGGILAFACITIIATGLGSWAASRVVATTSPRILILE